MRQTGGAALTVRVLWLGDEAAKAGPVLLPRVRRALSGLGALDVRTASGGEDRRAAARRLRGWCDRERIDLVLTVGRAGHRACDFAPEITAPLLERELPGVEERMCLAPPRRVEDLLFRGRAGLRRGTLVVNLPARASRAVAILRMLSPVIAHALEKARGDGAECARPRRPAR